MGLFNVKLCWLSRGFESQPRRWQMFGWWAAPPVTLSPISPLIRFTCVQWIRVFKSLSSLLRYRESMLMSNTTFMHCPVIALHCHSLFLVWNLHKMFNCIKKSKALVIATMMQKAAFKKILRWSDEKHFCVFFCHVKKFQECLLT